MKGAPNEPAVKLLVWLWWKRHCR